MVEGKPIRGRCLCGIVQFELVPPTDFCSHCHCESCRLAHGSAFVTWTSVPLKRFSYIQGKENVKWYQSSEYILWGFCQTCGSHMFYRAEKEGHPESPQIDRMYISVGSITDPLDRDPQRHVSYEERFSWMKAKDGLPKHRGKTEEKMGN